MFMTVINKHHIWRKIWINLTFPQKLHSFRNVVFCGKSTIGKINKRRLLQNIHHALAVVNWILCVTF